MHCIFDFESSRIQRQGSRMLHKNGRMCKSILISSHQEYNIKKENQNSSINLTSRPTLNELRIHEVMVQLCAMYLHDVGLSKELNLPDKKLDCNIKATYMLSYATFCNS